jgi:DNA helicase-2/ATP-dependent DNA helicase PcrA
MCYLTSPMRDGRMTLAMDLLSGLNPQQQQAVIAKTGPVLVLAGPGSGKTRVLTSRVAYLIEAMGVRPYNLLAVTFTNKAAREMEGRVTQLLGDKGRGLTLGTFHAICARILRREAEFLPFEANFVIYDSNDQLDLVKRSLDELNIDEKRYRPQAVHASISNAKNELLLPDDFPIQTYRDEVVARVYRRYQELLLTSNAVDFDDLLLWTAYLLDQEASVRQKYARRYEHILVDEFQDTNLAQYVLLKYLASFHHNIFVVGDTDQSIYRWRGADYRNVLRFEKDYPEAQVILLEQNYRSTQAILDVAMAVIDQHPYRTPKRLFTELGAGEKVHLHETYDDRAEAEYVIETISKLVARDEARPGDFAVMYRTNAQSRLLEEAFLQAGLPYKLVGAQRFYGRREVKDLIAYLRLIHNLNDEVSLLRVINTPARGIGTKTVLALRMQAKAMNLTPGETLVKMADGGETELGGRAAVVLSKFSVSFAKWRGHKHELSPLQLLDMVLEDTEYRNYIDDGSDDGQERWENVMELRRLASEFQETGLEAFLERVALVSDQDTLEEGANVPTLLTLHAAKGLEFPVVFIVGLSDGTLPHSRSFEDPEAMHEERRLLYVGITRAKKRLYLVYPQTRSAFGYAEPADPSRYLADIPDELLDVPGSTMHGGYVRSSQRPERHAHILPGGSAPVSEPNYHPGMRVQHNVWGEGMVLQSLVQDDDEIVDIFFEGIGLKRVAASLAKLEVKS